MSSVYQRVLARLQYVLRPSIGGEEEMIEEAVGRYLLLLGDGGIEDSLGGDTRRGCGRHAGRRTR